MKKYKVTPGQIFDRLEVIREVEPRGNGKRQVLCKCKCGATPIVDLYQLIGKRTKSCGCLGREKLELGRQSVDLTGQIFGRLKALHPEGENKSKDSVIWICECSCTPGKTVSVPARDLVSENTKSCGCLQTDFVRSLKDYNQQHHTVDGVFVPLLRQKVQTNNKTGTKGVSVRLSKDGKEQYIANITIKGKRQYLGIFETKEKAIEARQKAEEKYFKPYLDGDNND